jgi:hypothetical protein
MWWSCNAILTPPCSVFGVNDNNRAYRPQVRLVRELKTLVRPGTSARQPGSTRAQTASERRHRRNGMRLVRRDAAVRIVDSTTTDGSASVERRTTCGTADATKGTPRSRAASKWQPTSTDDQAMSDRLQVWNGDRVSLRQFFPQSGARGQTTGTHARWQTHIRSGPLETPDDAPAWCVD